MPQVFWEFSVSYFTGADHGPTSIGIDAKSAEDVHELGKLSGFDVTGWDRNGQVSRKITVKEQEGSERLLKLLTAIECKYGFKPSSTRIVPGPERVRVFGLTKHREYSLDEIDAAELLHISLAEKMIAEWREPTAEQVDEEVFAVEKRKQQTKVPLGFISPFLAIAVNDALKSDLKRVGLLGLEFESVINSEHIWKLTSSIHMPRCQLPLVNGQGEVVEADEWPGKWSDKYYDDSGYEPPELRYNKPEVRQLGDFDIAITAERTGGYKKTSFRRLVVSQKFRTTLDELGVKGVRYTPVRIEDETESNT